MSKRGKLFVFEGPDGVGKTTLARRLVDYLRSYGLPAVYFAWQEQNSLGRHVYQLYHSPERFGISSIHPESLQLMHVAAHIDTVQKYIQPLLRQDTRIVLDRFWWSTLVYGVVAGVDEDVLRAMIMLELRHWASIEPDVCFLVSRRSPLRPEISEVEWQHLCNSYQKIVEEERGRTQTFIVANDESLDDAMAQIVGIVDAIEASGGSQG